MPWRRLLCFSYVETTYTFAKEYAANRDDNNNVPLILHFVWVIQKIPEKYLDAISAFEKMNTNYEVKVKNNLPKHCICSSSS